MGFYARPSWKLWRQITADLFVVVWTAFWWWASRVAAGAVSAIAEPARQIAGSAGQVRDNFSDAGRRAAKVPVVGSDLSVPFTSAAGSMNDVVEAAHRQVAAIEWAATVTGVVFVALPVALVLAIWLPRRLRFRAQSVAARRFLDADADLDLFALRAMANQPLHVLAPITDDPVAAWRRNDREVIDRLADLELRRSGLPRMVSAHRH